MTGTDELDTGVFDSGELHGRLAALADRADRFDLAVDPYGAVRGRERVIRRRRLAGVAAVVVAVVVASVLGAGLLVPRATAPVRSAASPSVGASEDVPRHAPALPTGHRVGAGSSPGIGLTAHCEPGCPMFLEVSDGAGGTSWYELPAPPAPYPYEASLSPDGRWLSYWSAHGVVLRDLTGTTTRATPYGTRLVGWQPYRTGGEPVRWALTAQSPVSPEVFRFDLTTGATVRYLTPTSGATVPGPPLGLMPDGDLLVAGPAPGGGTGEELSVVDPVTGHTVRQVPLAPHWDFSQKGTFIAPDGLHAVLTPRWAGIPTPAPATALLVDLRTGQATPYDLAALGSRFVPLVTAGATWAALGFLAGDGRFSAQAVLSNGDRVTVTFQLTPAGLAEASALADGKEPWLRPGQVTPNLPD